MNNDQPSWTEQDEANLTDVTDSQYWRIRGDFYRALRASVTKDHPMAFYWGWSGWWCSKNQSNGTPRPNRQTTNRQEDDQ